MKLSILKPGIFSRRVERTDERSSRTTVLNNILLHLHPVTVPADALRFSYTWGLGGISAVLALLLGLTGLLLMFRYDARVEYAYISIQEMETKLIFGSLIRSVHHWSANLLVVTTFLHLLRVFFTAGFKQGRTTNWIIGIGLLVLVLVSNFTGYLLPWDQLAYWAITVSTSLLAYIPVLGDELSRFLLAGPEVGQGALTNFFVLHVVVLPILLVGIMAYHFWKIRKNGGISQPLEQKVHHRVPTSPNLISIEFAMAAFLIMIVLLFSMVNPAPIGQIANPLDSPNPAKAAWYFLGLQELLLHMHPLAAITLIVIVFGWLVLAPKFDRDEQDIGIYFRSRRGRWAAVFATILAADLVPLLVVLDEFWLDLGAVFPNWPDYFVTGVVPLVVSLLGIALVYGLTRLFISHGGQRANHSEAMLGVFTFLMVSLIMLTIIGNLFRGPNMALIVPWF